MEKIRLVPSCLMGVFFRVVAVDIGGPLLFASYNAGSSSIFFYFFLTMASFAVCIVVISFLLLSTGFCSVLVLVVLVLVLDRCLLFASHNGFSLCLVYILQQDDNDEAGGLRRIHIRT